MALMERVATLIRANLNDLMDQAEDPEKMLKQVMLDMRNQLRQVKTQLAIAIAGQHLLEKKRKDHEEQAADWVRKAELAVSKEQDDLARAAIEKSMQSGAAAESFQKQLDHQSAEVENLKAALGKLQRKLAEAQTGCDVLAAEHRRARVLERAGEARLKAAGGISELALDRMKNQVAGAEAMGRAASEMAAESLGDRLAALEKHDRVEQMLAGMKARRG